MRQRETLGGAAGPPERPGWYAPSRDCTVFRGNYWIREIARIALQRRTGARGLRSVVEETLEGVLFEAEAGVRYLVTDKTVRGGEPLKQSMSQTRAPLSWHVLRRLAAKNAS